MRSGSSLPLFRALFVLPAFFCWALDEPASAQDGANRQPQIEVWTGAEVFDHVWSLYVGGTYAPFGSVREDGFRLRVVAGYGAYTYSSPRWTGVAVKTFEFQGSNSFVDLLAGYHKQLGALTIKVFGGVIIANQAADDPESATLGTGVGAKGAVETWWNVTDQLWTSVDVSWATLHNVYGSRARVGWRLWPEFSVGLEGGATGTWDYDTARFGGFVRYEWSGGEASVSGGLSGDGPGSGWASVQGPFGTVNLLTRF